MGPVQEDFSLAYQQVITECNSVTDGPLTNSPGASLRGGNFQAKAITSAMEKTRQGLQSIGRMLFAQATELINPPRTTACHQNLTIDPPSQSFILKGVDIMCASLLSELSSLANPVGSHVQTAEMGNQALNFLALISTRYTHTAADILSKLCAAHPSEVLLRSNTDPIRLGIRRTHAGNQLEELEKRSGKVSYSECHLCYSIFLSSLVDQMFLQQVSFRLKNYIMRCIK